MNGLDQARILGGIGSLLMVLSIVPSAGGVLYIVGLVLVLVAVKQIADALREQKIFNDVLIAVILGIVGLAVGLAVGFSGFFSFFRLGGPPARVEEFWELFRGRIPLFIITLLIGLLAVWVFLIVSTIFFRRGLNAIGERMGAGYFKTAGLLYLIGAVLVVVVVGFIIIFVASIILTIAFFTMPVQQPSQQPP
ncbi:hypothetical protein HRbin01_00644 [archaeon HR01]|nr:hypothetical protein HRbin01_00644 [archaeon HR01]